MPMAVHIFLEAYDLTEKTIITFCTYEGNGMGRSVADIRRLCHSAIVLDGAATPLFQRLLDLPKLDAR